MGARHSTSDGLRDVLSSSARDFVSSHCVLGDDETSSADLFMEAFVRYLHRERRDTTETLAKNYCTAAWMAEIVEAESGLQFVGNSPRLSKIPYTHHYVFEPTTVIGARLANLSILWPSRQWRCVGGGE